ncbi:MAG: hypothetical protein CMC35_08980 [Flavobacteriaceae bacterium]|nr:hypothetical protein [Flavobacteriaceae bacterium]|tara:strand:- start:4416 stop:5228 length:813 start_codon:yes stop_codon:yes gene_type:complete
MNPFRAIIYVFLFGCSLSLQAQEVERTVINGRVTAPQGEDIEGINLYNISSQKGTVTEADGSFTLAVAEQDRILVSAIQFQSFKVIVDEGVINNKQLRIYLNPAVNELEEVIVRPYDLSGNVIADVDRIKVSTVGSGFDLSYENLEFKMDFRPDRQSSIKRNIAAEALNQGANQAGANLLGLAGLLFPKKKQTPKEVVATKEALTVALRQRFSNTYITETFDIESARVNDFIYFVEENGLQPHLLKETNEIRLLEHLHQQSELYKSRVQN